MAQTAPAQIKIPTTGAQRGRRAPTPMRGLTVQVAGR
jgi:hypothetical protein